MNGRLLARADLTGEQRAAMLTLMQTHFEGVTAAQFERDLAEKNWVIVLEDATRNIRGFSTLQAYESVVAPVRVIYSGDTIVDRKAWGSSVLARTWIAAARELQVDYWLLITSGFRTYRFLPVFWREFWPRWNAPQAPPLLDALARERFGRCYEAGIVHFERPQVLRGKLREVPAGREADPHIAFFAARNPGWVRGDELVCLCELSPSNLTAAGERMVRARECVPA